MKLILQLAFLLVLMSCQEKKTEIIVDSSQAPKEVKNTIEKIEAKTGEIEDVDLSIVMGKYEPSEHPDFVEIDGSLADREGLYLQKEAYGSYREMQKAAKQEGIDLVIRSATRNFNYQKGIWERKWKTNAADQQNYSDNDNALQILKYSSMPGTSRHHWGTDIDLNAFENTWFESGEGLKLYNWLEQNAGSYGFCQVYSEKNEERPHGYNEEKWHWSYLPIAKKYYELAQSHMKDELISGFEGSDEAKQIGVVEKYILGINKKCSEWQ